MHYFCGIMSFVIEAIESSRHSISSRDGWSLDAILFEPTNPQACFQINSATGVKKEFYKNFAAYLAEQGYVVVIFDYRGIGGSRPASLRGFQALNHEWGMKDMAAVLDWLDARFPHLQKYFIGHSAGGQQLGFMDNAHKISKAMAVSASTGYWKNLRTPYKYFTLFIWYVLAPATAYTVGYVPSSWFGLGEDLPKGVALEWRSWCLNKNYYGSFLKKTIPEVFFSEVRCPMRFLFPSDDNIATDQSVDQLRSFYQNSITTVEKIHPREFGRKAIGHFGIFSRASRETIWPKILRYFESE